MFSCRKLEMIKFLAIYTPGVWHSASASLEVALSKQLIGNDDEYIAPHILIMIHCFPEMNEDKSVNNSTWSRNQHPCSPSCDRHNESSRKWCYEKKLKRCCQYHQFCSQKYSHSCPMSPRTAALMSVHATPMRSMDGMTRAVTTDIMSVLLALTGK
jgi:hypothetical protein